MQADIEVHILFEGELVDLVIHVMEVLTVCYIQMWKEGDILPIEQSIVWHCADIPLILEATF
jgi:hypothetical protein